MPVLGLARFVCVRADLCQMHTQVWHPELRALTARVWLLWLFCTFSCTPTHPPGSRPGPCVDWFRSRAISYKMGLCVVCVCVLCADYGISFITPRFFDEGSDDAGSRPFLRALIVLSVCWLW